MASALAPELQERLEELDKELEVRPMSRGLLRYCGTSVTSPRSDTGRGTNALTLELVHSAMSISSYSSYSSYSFLLPLLFATNITMT